MAAKSYSLKFQGYWREEKAGGVPNKSGVYGVYTCTHDKTKGTVTLHKLVYIGQAADCQDRISNHTKKPKWQKHLKKGQELCYSFGSVASADRDRVEAALIFKHKPPENVEYRDTFPFDETTIQTSGRNQFLKPKFTVKRTE